MDEVVIAGISGRLPESNNLEEFWENLINGVDMVTEDDRRWKPGIISLSDVTLKSQSLPHLLTYSNKSKTQFRELMYTDNSEHIITKHIFTLLIFPISHFMFSSHLLY